MFVQKMALNLRSCLLWCLISCASACRLGDEAANCHNFVKCFQSAALLIKTWVGNSSLKTWLVSGEKQRTCWDTAVLSLGVRSLDVLSIFHLVFLSDVLPSLILFATTSPAFLIGGRFTVGAGRLALALKPSLGQGVWAGPPSRTAGGLVGSRRGWQRSCWGRRHRWGWRGRGRKAPEVESGLISSPPSSPQSWEGALCRFGLLIGHSSAIKRHWSLFTARTAAAICNWLNHSCDCYSHTSIYA